MRNYIFFFCFLLLYQTSTGQFTFQLDIKDSLDQIPVQIFESNTGDRYILNELVGRRTVQDYHTRISTIDSEGKIITTNLYKDSIFQYSIENIIPVEDNHYLGFGFQKKHFDSLADFTIVTMDERFIVTQENCWPITMSDLSLIQVKYINNNYFVFGSGLDRSNNTFNICAFKLSSNLELLESAIYLGAVKIAFDLLPGISDNNMRLFVRGFSQQTNTPGQILLIDTSLNIIEIKGIPQSLHNAYDAKYFNTQTYLLSGKKIVWNSSPQDDNMAIMKMDLSDAVQDFNIYGAIDTIDNPGSYSSLDFLDTNNIYFGGTNNFDIATLWSGAISWFVLNKLNSTLELQWQKFYGGDAYYNSWNLLATQDGGCLMAGTRYDYYTQNYERDVFLVKVNEDGLIVGTGDELPNISVQDAIVYPNPGNESFTIQSGPQINGALFELFDMNGALMLSATLDERMKTISTALLPRGTFPYRITFDNKTVGSGKWVKQ
ncbi:MAG: T9SS type A sorting domain-containing protein [Bacteroidales bacterium]